LKKSSARADNYIMQVNDPIHTPGNYHHHYLR
jgi:hypothetical protein